MSTLAQLEARIAARLVDAGNAVFATATIDEGLRAALSDYSSALPQASETYITLPGDGHEIALSCLAGLMNVLDVWWPFDPDSETWPPNQVSGFRVWWDQGQPVLLLASNTSSQPQAGDNLRVWYTLPHTISGLDGGSYTSVFPLHESGLVTGAAAYVASSAEIDQIGTIRVDPTEVPALRQWSADRMAEFRTWLAAVAASAPSSGPTFADGWGIDKWDSNRNPRQSRYPLY